MKMFAIMALLFSGLCHAQTSVPENEQIPYNMGKYDKSETRLLLRFNNSLGVGFWNLNEDRIIFHDGKVISAEQVTDIILKGRATVCSVILKGPAGTLGGMIGGDMLIDDVSYGFTLRDGLFPKNPRRFVASNRGTLQIDSPTVERIYIERSIHGRKDMLTNEHLTAEALKITPAQLRTCLGSNVDVLVIPNNK